MIEADVDDLHIYWFWFGYWLMLWREKMVGGNGEGGLLLPPHKDNLRGNNPSPLDDWLKTSIVEGNISQTLSPIFVGQLCTNSSPIFSYN